jgi:glycosyltransferase involved in cell wall biosynthesis
MPRVSIVITTYNRSALLPHAIESAKHAARDREVVVVDDCSSDDTPELCSTINDISYIRVNANRGLLTPGTPASRQLIRVYSPFSTTTTCVCQFNR